MTNNLVTWIGRATALGTGLVTATYLPVVAAVVTLTLLSLVVWLALVSTHATTKSRRDAARATLALILCSSARDSTQNDSR